MLLVFADKLTNLYEMPDTDCNRLLDNNIASNYRKCETGVKHRITKETRKIAEQLNSFKKMDYHASRPAFITIKDHKPNFQNNTKCRLLNPSKSELGLTSKKLLEKIIMNVANTIIVNQWRNTTTVRDWFKSLPQKGKSRQLLLLEVYQVKKDLFTINQIKDILQIHKQSITNFFTRLLDEWTKKSVT